MDKKVLNELHSRLSKVKSSAILDTNYIAEQIRDSDAAPFRTIGATERPDIVAAKLLEGRIAVFSEGCPMALTLPFLFLELFQSNEDYYVSYHYASFQRFLRIIGFFISVLMPSFFVALACYQPDLLPSSLAITIAQARQNVPFSTLAEALLLLLIFDLLRESGARSPSNVGQALAVVSSIVLGQAAIEAGYVGSPILIITAFSGVTGVMLPRLIGASSSTVTDCCCSPPHQAILAFPLDFSCCCCGWLPSRASGFPTRNTPTSPLKRRPKTPFSGIPGAA